MAGRYLTPQGFFRAGGGGRLGFFDFGPMVIMVLLLGVIWELDRVREYTDTLREIASKNHLGEPPSN